MKWFYVMCGVLITLAAPAVAAANDGAFHGEGATVFAYKEHRIRMVSETIRIRYAPSRAHPDAGWAADCTFEFENLTDQPMTLQMGFPDQSAFPSRAWTIRAFQTVIKGKPVKAIHKAIRAERERGPDLVEMLRTGDPGERGAGGAQPGPAAEPAPDPWRVMARETQKRMDLHFSAAYTWPVTFAPRERIIVKNRYRFGGAGTNGPIELCLENRTSPGGHFWHASPPITGLGGGPCSEVTYVVTSGKTWLAPIGEAVIEIDIPPGVAPNHVIPLPPATEVTANTVKWHFKDFRPTEELRVVFATSMNADDEASAMAVDFESTDQLMDWLAFGRANGFTSGFIASMYDIQAYSFGIREKGAPKPLLFDKYTQPKVDSPRRASALTPVERQILELLRAAVKRAK